MKMDGPIARTYHDDETATLVASTDIGEHTSRIAERYGLSGPEAIKFVKGFIWKHELFHVWDRENRTSKDEGEITIGELLAEFYEEMAETSSEKDDRYYRALRDYNIEYADDYRKGRVTQDNPRSSKLEALVKEYASEAKEKGLKGNDARDYVSSKLDHEAEKLEESDNGVDEDAGSEELYNSKDSLADGETSEDASDGSESDGGEE